MRISLDGEWQLATDEANVGREGEWYRHLPSRVITAPVPSALQEHFPGYHGVAWYWRRFDAPSNPHSGGRVLLRCWAIDYLAEVWVNGVFVGGHEGGETPFKLDITDALYSHTENVLAIRVLNPTTERIDGIVLAETPHRNKAVPHYVGGSYNYGGILESVELLCVSAIHFEDVFARPDPQTGLITLDLNVSNVSGQPQFAEVSIVVDDATGGGAFAESHLRHKFQAGSNALQTQVQLQQFTLWDLHEPCLYRISVRLHTSTGQHDEYSLRCGFRDFRVVDGFFRLNGRRIFLRSTHTGNHAPVGQIIAPRAAPDLLRRDLLYAKSLGFNMVRFIAGIAHPWQLDVCDELGLLVYEESLAAWVLADSPHMAKRFDTSLCEMVLRDRNHPSLVIWGLLNETKDGPVFRHAVESLTLLRTFDPSRLVLLSSGRWDAQPSIGSVSNPGSTVWEHVWGREAPDAPAVPATWHKGIGGYIEDAGDAHAYPMVPHTSEIVTFLRTLGEASKPVFVSEYGIGSTLNAIREWRLYEQHDVNLQAEDAVLMRSMAEKLIADWQRYDMAGAYAFPEEMLRDSQRLHARQRLLGFDAIRANPNICGYNLTGMLDHGMTGEGVWTFWREFKPGLADALVDGWAPLRWCIFVDPTHVYAGQPFTLEVVLANEDVLLPGEYPVCCRIVGAQGIVWESSTVVHVPQHSANDPGPLAIPILKKEVRLSVPAGAYEVIASIERGAAPAGGRLRFYLANPPPLQASTLVVGQWGLSAAVQDWLAKQGIACRPVDTDGDGGGDWAVVLVGDPGSSPKAEAHWPALLNWVARGGTAIFLSPTALSQGDEPTGRLPLASRVQYKPFHDWLYHKECVAKPHRLFAGLAAPGIMDWDYYGPVIPPAFFTDQETPDDVAAAAFAVGYSCPGGYASGLLLAAYRHGAGRLILNTLRILENLGQHPAADRLMLNLVQLAK